MTNKVLWNVEDGVCTITLNAPEIRNAFDREMMIATAALFDRAAQDDAVKVVVFTGAGDAFCAGGNVKEMGSADDPAERKELMQNGVHQVPRAIMRMDKPTIAMINGAAFGAGLDMALACDMRLVASNAKLSESYIHLGLIAGDGGAWLLPKIVGLPVALELLLSGRTITGQEAADLGIANRAVPQEDLRTATWELAVELASKPPVGLSMMKRLVYQSQTCDFDTALELASSQLAILQCGAEHKNALAEFRAKRSARTSTEAES